MVMPVPEKKLQDSAALLVGVGELSRMLGKSVRTIKRYLADGKIPEPVISDPPQWHRDQFSAKFLFDWRRSRMRLE